MFVPPVFPILAGIFGKADIENPMQGMLDSPVLPHRLGKPRGIPYLTSCLQPVPPRRT